MDDLYIKDNNGHYAPVTFDIVSPKDLENKLIIITVGSNDDPATSETIEFVQKYFKNSKGIIEAMLRSSSANLLIIPHTIRVELISNEELETKTICVRVENGDQIKNFPEIKNQIKEELGKEAIILPVPLSIDEYEEVKSIKNRMQVRKQRNGGGIDNR